MHAPIRLWGGACSLIWLSPAFADNCDNLGNNKAWVNTFNQLNEAYEGGDYNTALQHSHELENICELSPILNYTIAYIHKGLGDNEKYLFYLQKSTQNTDRFSVGKELLDKIWSDKYIAAYPDADPENIKRINEKLEATTAELSRLVATTITKEESYQIQSDDYKTTMWIGAGIGIGGLVLGGVGAALVVTSDPIKFKSSHELPAKYKEEPLHIVGWSLVGVGSALTITGAVLAGIYGYKYKRAKDYMNLTFNISPTSASLAFQF